MSKHQWDIAKEDILTYIENASHRNRLRNLVDDELLDYTFKMNSSEIVPILKNYKIVPAKTD